MDKIKNLMLSLAIAGACSGMAFANTTFTPLNFEDANYSNTPNTKIAATTTATPTATAVDMTGNTKMQSAISALDNAQVEVRNELLNYRTQYAEIDAQYIKIKSERSALSKQLKATEKRIKEIDRAKEKIKKNMM